MSISSSLSDTFKSLLSQDQAPRPSGMLKVGDKFPPFKVKAVPPGEARDMNPKDALIEISHNSYPEAWLVAFSVPKAFTFICPTEIFEFSKLNSEFKDRGAQVLCFSTDNEFALLAWRKHHKDLNNINFPLLADVKREISTQCGILDKNEGVAQRATFIVDPEGIIRFVMVTDLGVGRNTREVLRILDALQTGELCPCNWQKGEETL